MARCILYIATDHPISLPSTTTERCLSPDILFYDITLMRMFNGILYECLITDMFYSEINDLLTELDRDSSGLPIEFLLYDTVDLFGSSDDRRLNAILKRLQKNMVHISNAIRNLFRPISSFGKRIFRR